MEHHLITRPLPRYVPRFHRLVSHRWGRVAAALALAAAAAGAAVTASGASPAGAATTLVVNASQPFRTVTHVASGGLYGLDTATVPADSLVEPLHPNTFVQMAPGGKQLPTASPPRAATSSSSRPRRPRPAPRSWSACPTGTRTSPTSG